MSQERIKKMSELLSEVIKGSRRDEKSMYEGKIKVFDGLAEMLGKDPNTLLDEFTKAMEREGFKGSVDYWLGIDQGFNAALVAVEPDMHKLDIGAMICLLTSVSGAAKKLDQLKQ